MTDTRFAPGDMAWYQPQANNPRRKMAVVREQKAEPPYWCKVAYGNLNCELTCHWVRPEQLERMQGHEGVA